MNVPDGWGKTFLGKIFEFRNGVNAEKSSYGQGIKFINVMDIFHGNFILAEKISGKILLSDKKIKKNLVIEGDVLFNRTSEISEEIALTSVYLGNEKVVFGGFVIKGHPKDKSLDNMFKKYCFFSENVRKEIIRRGQGAVRTNIGQKDLSKVPILIPPLPEQKAIADLLSTWDKAIEKTQRLIHAKEQFKIGQLQELITNNKANSTIGAFAKPIIRKVTKPSEPYVALGIRSHFKGTFQRNVEDPNSLSMDTLYKVKKDDLIVNITFAWEGAIALVKEEDEKCYVSHRFPTYRIIQEKAEASFVRQLILSSRMKYDLSNISPGGAGRNRVLNKKDFLKMPIWVPHLKKQKNIGELLGTLDQEINLLKQLAEKYKTQKRGLMQKLLTGKWRVKHEILKKYEAA